jgi:uncharacterized metal-binding protein YceD (DUF177 family)
MEKPGKLWSVPVAVEDIPDTGLHIEIAAPAAARAEVAELAAELAAVRELPELSAVFDLTRQGAGVHVAGHVTARVEQSCVVTLEPIESIVEEVVDLRFAPTSADATPRPDEEPPEPLVGGKVDLGAIATEFLILGIEPYPRKPDAEFSPPQIGDDGAHPFAALEALKKRPGDGQL